MKRLLVFFLRGAMVVIPVALTIYAVVLTFTTLDRLLPFGVPGVGLLVSLAVVTLVGFLTSNVIGRTLVEEFEGMLARVPLVKLVYASVKDLMNAFVGDQKRFDRPVTVRIGPETDARMLGFVTRDELARLGLPDHVAVYFPQSYNFAGNVVLVPRQHVQAVPANSGDVMTFLVSGGVSGLTSGDTSGKPPRPPSAAPPQ